MELRVDALLLDIDGTPVDSTTLEFWKRAAGTAPRTWRPAAAAGAGRRGLPGYQLVAAGLVAPAPTPVLGVGSGFTVRMEPPAAS